MKNRLKELRQGHQWSQSDLARALNVSRQAVHGIELGKFEPSLDMAFRLAHLFNVAIEDVFIYEAKTSMQTFVERVKNFLGFEFGGERFTEPAIQAINFARNEAVRLENSQVEPEHLLAGLLADSSTIAARLLQAHGVTLDVPINENSFVFRENLKFSPQSKFVLELALQIVRLQDKKLIGTEHLLWGLVRLSETDRNALSEQFQPYGINYVTLNTQLTEVI